MQPSSPHLPPQRPLPPIHPPHVVENYTAPEFEHETEPAPAAPQVITSDSPAAQAHHPDYDFILNPAAVQSGRSAAAGPSLGKRLLIAGGGLIVLLMLFVVAKNLLSNTPSNAADLLNVAQQQQELIHIATAAAKQPGVAVSTLNSSATVSAAVTSAQQQLTTYMKSVGQKVDTAQLNLKVSNAIDTQLTSAAAAGTYNQTYQSTVQTALTTYEQALKQAYAQTTGPRGRALLSNEYNGAQLLLKQLNSAAS